MTHPAPSNHPARSPGSGTLWPDLVAGVTVALVAVPQSMAYAELAGLPAHLGLYAAALPALLAAFFASSAWIQTGPVATTSLLTLGALSTLATPDDLLPLAALLAVVVGLVRVAIGVLRAGAISYLMTTAVLRGFIFAAALLIFASQLPAALGVSVSGGTVLGRAAQVLAAPTTWDLGAVGFSLLTLVLVLGGRRVHPMFPGVLVAALVSLGISEVVGYGGPRLGVVPSGLPTLSWALPWERLPDLLVPGAVIAVLGFAEAASIARAYAEQEGTSWDPNREFVSQGVANLAAGFSGGFPVGASFSRSALNHLAGAKTRLAGGVTGVAVLLLLPVAGALEPLPKAVLGATVIAAVRSLLRLGPLRQLWAVSRLQGGVALATFGLTLALAPRVELAVVAGVMLSAPVAWWERRSSARNIR